MWTLIFCSDIPKRKTHSKIIKQNLMPIGYYLIFYRASQMPLSTQGRKKILTK